MKAVLLISHGSHSAKTKTEVHALTKQLQKKSPGTIFKYAFLEVAAPNIPDGIAECIRAGANQVTVLLNFLNSGKHVDVDIPVIIKEARLQYPKVKFVLTRPVGQHPQIVKLFLDMLNGTR